MANKNYLVTGGSGFIGTQLIKQLLIDGQSVTVLTRDKAKTYNHFVNVLMSSALDNIDKLNLVTNLSILVDSHKSFDVVINLAGQGIADKRWSDKVKQQLLDSRLNTTKSLYDYLEKAEIKPDVFISGSALGYYGLHNSDEKITESGQGDNSFSSLLCDSWEKEAKRIEKLGIRTCYLRTGIVLGKNGGALSRMLLPFKLGLGGPMGNGKQWMSWIHMDDMIGIIRYLVDQKMISGAINVTAPTPVTNSVFSSTLARILKRPAFIPMPAFVMKLMMGEMAEELLLSGQRVVPEKMVKAGYQFKHPELEEGLDNIINE